MDKGPRQNSFLVSNLDVEIRAFILVKSNDAKMALAGRHLKAGVTRSRKRLWRLMQQPYSRLDCAVCWRVPRSSAS